MDHTEAIRSMAAEKYFLSELTPELRDSFEEHFFSCQECAADVRATAVFLDNAKTQLGTQTTEPVPAPVPAPAKTGWLTWLRPAIAAPVIAVLLAIISYQTFVTRPHLENQVAALSEPGILHSTWLTANVRRSGGLPVVSTHPGDGFLLLVDIAPTRSYSSYSAELTAPDGSRKWALPITPELTQNTVPIRVPPGLTQEGSYSLVVFGTDADGHRQEVASYPFQLQLR